MTGIMQAATPQACASGTIPANVAYSTRRAAAPRRSAIRAGSRGRILRQPACAQPKRVRAHRPVLREEAPQPAVLAIAHGEVAVHPPRDRAGGLAVAREALRIAFRQARDVAVAHPLLEEAPAVARPEPLPVVEARRRALPDVLHEHALVVDDVEIVHPRLEGEVDVFAARDLVLLAPRAELGARRRRASRRRSRRAAR